MFMYAKYHADHGAKCIIIATPDTDVAALCCHHFHLSLRSCDQLWLRTGTGSNCQFIPIHDICAKLGLELCKLLPGFHSLTGCDSTGSFSGIGKKRAFKVLQKHGQDIPNLALLGSQPTINEILPLVAACTKFVCHLFDDKGETTDVNDLRYQLFCQKQLSGEKLPPTSDALVCHVKRANYQCFIWKQACKGKLELPSPVGNGWSLEDGVLEQELMTEPLAPEVCTELTCCKCKKGFKSNSCSCPQSHFLCTDACCCSSFETCENDDASVIVMTVVKCLHVPVNFLCGVTLSSSNIKLWQITYSGNSVMVALVEVLPPSQNTLFGEKNNYYS